MPRAFHVERSSAGSLEELLERASAELGDPLPGCSRDRLVRLAELVAAWGSRLNLTGRPTPEAVLGRLIVDALALALHGLSGESFSSAADVGSGAGFPGLPWAIRYPERRFTLIEPRRRRHHFQRAAARELGLRNATALLGRAEDLVAEPHDLAVAQALARPGRALPLILPWAREGGLLVLPGGSRPPDPGSSEQVVEARLTSYRVPLGGPDRTAWVARRRGVPGAGA